MRFTAKGIVAGVVVAALSLGLASCGVRGSLDPPPGAKANGTAKSAESAGTQPEFGRAAQAARGLYPRSAAAVALNSR